ncbi:malonate--CoA ligase ACSF3, mitochondrial-like [Haliotis cracherodii]|uniref:malonate--CoA ligase ACSF3, mitochondrial-like n=1 Tax=Haliotis cracherodii TaxID=6455 RepID=UPI0039E9AF7B
MRVPPVLSLLKGLRHSLTTHPISHQLMPVHVPATRLRICRRCFSELKATRNSHVIPLFLKAEEHVGRTAIVDQNNRFSYDDILHYSSLLSQKIISRCNRNPKTGIEGARVTFLCENDISYVVAQWATWMCGGVAVPLCNLHSDSDLAYYIQDSQSSLLVTTTKYAERLQPIAEDLEIQLETLQASEYMGSYDSDQNSWFLSDNPASSSKKERRRIKGRYDDLLATNQYKRELAMIVYTSGTTGRPKGVVLTHGNLNAMMSGMITAWEWQPSDVVLHVLPLHHVHGIVNVLMTPLFVGATCVMMPSFNPAKVWSRLTDFLPGDVRVNVFMAVPTIYAKLLQYYDTEFNQEKKFRKSMAFIRSACSSRIRLMVSGSAALPEPIMKQWEEVTGHRLLERYGMTEIGMALTNPLHGPRIAGSVGQPFPEVEVCIVQNNVYAENGYDILARGNSRTTTVYRDGEQGELLVRGPGVFHKYWGKPGATSQAFTRDGWFKTGDTVMFKDGVYRIMGRTSVDIIKSGGYKISALDVERHLLAHPDIQDCAVIGLPDITWGQKVAAILVCKEGRELTVGILKEWARNYMPSYQIPTVVRCLDKMPRNAMGKVNKKEIVEVAFPETVK